MGLFITTKLKKNKDENKNILIDFCKNILINKHLMFF